jgi:hypothetical protein
MTTEHRDIEGGGIILIIGRVDIGAVGVKHLPQLSWLHRQVPLQ